MRGVAEGRGEFEYLRSKYSEIPDFYQKSGRTPPTRWLRTSPEPPGHLPCKQGRQGLFRHAHSAPAGFRGGAAVSGEVQLAPQRGIPQFPILKGGGAADFVNGKYNRKNGYYQGGWREKYWYYIQKLRWGLGKTVFLLTNRQKSITLYCVIWIGSTRKVKRFQSETFPGPLSGSQLLNNMYKEKLLCGAAAF